MKTRLLRPEENWKSNLTMAVAFEGDYDLEKAKESAARERTEEEKREDARNRCFGTFLDDDETICGVVNSREYLCRFDGGTYKLGGVGGVSTLPQYRRGGVIRACMTASLKDMYANDFTFAFLYPFSMQYYRKFGFEAGAPEYRWSVPFTAMKPQDVGGRDVSVALSKTFGTDANQVTLSFAGNEAVTLDEQQAIAQSLSDAYADRTFNVVESSSVDPTMGAKFFQKCLVCLLITFVILLVYIALRFKKIGGLSAGVTALIALVHDVLLVYFAFVIFGFSINDIFIAVILTILGYSLNDTIVIYDRIRENRKLSPTNSPDALPAIVNKSLNQTMTRSVLTSLTTFMALLVIYIVAAVYGISSVQSFALPMMVGTIVGCYSSLCIAAPLYTMWAVHKGEKSKK